MGPEKHDNFSQKRATNIDGFFARPVDNRPRQPAFRPSPVKPQLPTATLPDMPKRSSPQPVLGNAASVAATMQPGVAVANPPFEGGRRRRRQGSEFPPDETPKGRRHRHKSAKPRSWKRRLKRSGMVLGVLVLLTGAFFGFKFYKDIAKITGNKNPFALLSVFRPVPLQNQNGRVNILVAGNSADDPGHGGANLTDSIMVLSINTQNNTALILSVPRDLWVNIPGYGHAKINAAYPDGGMNKLQEVVQDNLGLTIDYRALVNYGAFKDLVDAVGGIRIDIQSSDPRGIYDPNIDYTTKTCCSLAKYPNGWVTLNGKQALNLARARADPSPYGIPYGFTDGDFDRTMHQRQMILAIKDKASQSDVIANPFKVSALVDAVGNNVSTNIKLDEIETMYADTKKVNDKDIASYNINTLKGNNTTMLANYTTPDGQSALIPAAGIDDFSAIQAQIQRILTSDPVSREGATVEVLNGTSTTGLAATQEYSLTHKGMTVSVADAPATQPTTTIIDDSQGQKPNTLAYLKQHYNATIVKNANLTYNYPGADFILILGQSAAPHTSTSTTSTPSGQ